MVTKEYSLNNKSVLNLNNTEFQKYTMFYPNQKSSLKVFDTITHILQRYCYEMKVNEISFFLFTTQSPIAKYFRYNLVNMIT